MVRSQHQGDHRGAGRVCPSVTIAIVQTQIGALHLAIMPASIMQRFSSWQESRFTQVVYEPLILANRSYLSLIKSFPPHGDVTICGLAEQQTSMLIGASKRVGDKGKSHHGHLHGHLQENTVNGDMACAQRGERVDVGSQTNSVSPPGLTHETQLSNWATKSLFQAACFRLPRTLPAPDSLL
jgi:hypothetical protein